jgi:hypothetical protein
MEVKSVVAPQNESKSPRYRITRVLIIVAIILSIPFFAMLNSTEVRWSLFDFIFAGVILSSIGLAYEFLSNIGGNVMYKAGFAIGLLSSFIIIWSNLAVGIIGSEDNPANLMYFGVLAIVFLGAIIAQFKPKGMSFALFAAASAQAIITIIALVANLGAPVNSTSQIVFINAFFIVLWLASGLLFKNAINYQSSTK